MAAYYNENDPDAVAWLRKLMAGGHIAPGKIDDRDIKEVRTEEVKEFTQCHFFAGIGVWSYALRSAGWPDSRPVWTGSCPCQPFSSAGKRMGTDDPRHLWPQWYRIIKKCQPATIFGEQVSSPDGLNWIDTVQDDLESSDYAVAPLDLCAAGVGAPQIRQRLFWVGHSNSTGRIGRGIVGCRTKKTKGRKKEERTSNRRKIKGYSKAGNVGLHNGISRKYFVNGFWKTSDWIWCRDQRWRPVEPGTFPLAHGAAGRVGRLRGYGNAICAPLAEEFIRAYMEI